MRSGTELGADDAPEDDGIQLLRWRRVHISTQWCQGCGQSSRSTLTATQGDTYGHPVHALEDGGVQRSPGRVQSSISDGAQMTH